MKLFWKIFVTVFISFVVISLGVAYILVVNEISNAEKHILEENRILVSLISKEIEKGYVEYKWPFEALRKLSERKDFLSWWVVRDDGTIHIANDASFMGTYAYDYFPQIANMTVEEDVFLSRKQNYGIFLKPLQIRKEEWSFWFSFSLRELLEIKKRIFFWATVISMSTLALLGVILYFTIMYLTEPIEDIAIGAARVGKGDLSYRVNIESKDELGELAHSFNKMTEDLQKTTVSRDYIDNILKSMSDVLIVIDPEGVIETVNQATLDLLGYKQEELIGKDVKLLFSEKEEEEEEEEGIPLKGTKLEKLIREGQLTNYEINYQAKDGRKIPMLFSGSVMKDKHRNIIYIVCTARDITERKKAEEELKKKMYELETFQKIAVGRELKMVELKNKIKELETKFG